MPLPIQKDKIKVGQAEKEKMQELQGNDRNLDTPKPLQRLLQMDQVVKVKTL